MDASDSAAVVVAVASSVAVVVLIYAVASLTKSVREMRTVIRQFHEEAMPVVIEMRAAMDHANSELERVDSLLDSAESVTHTVDSATRLAYLAFSNPAIKTVAIASGTGQAVRRLRRRKNGAG
jgi:hypothetical protein